MKKLYTRYNWDSGQEYYYDPNGSLYLKTGWNYGSEYFSEDVSKCLDIIYDPESKAKFHVKNVLQTVNVVWIGWDSDEEAWLVEMIDGSIKLLTTSHGEVIEEDKKFLQDKIKEYQDMIQSYQTIIEKLEEI